jgi:hypothetical protein
VRLWREYSTFAHHTLLLCMNCAEKRSLKSESADWKSSFAKGEGMDIGWYVPAIPCENEAEAYWGLGSTPEAGWAWWKSLPISR